MTGMSHLGEEPRSTGSYQVRSPRAADGVGGALRSVFGDSLMLPQDMVCSLQRIDRLSTPTLLSVSSHRAPARGSDPPLRP